MDTKVQFIRNYKHGGGKDVFEAFHRRHSELNISGGEKAWIGKERKIIICEECVKAAVLKGKNFFLKRPVQMTAKCRVQCKGR